MAGLMAGLVLVLTLFASSESLHRALHKHSTANHVQCAICSIQQGKLDLAQSSQPMAIAPLHVAWTLPQHDSQFSQSFDYSLSPSRGPPAFASL